MPLKPKYQKIYAAMVKEYGPEKGRKIFYATANKNGWIYDKRVEDIHQRKKEKPRQWKRG